VLLVALNERLPDGYKLLPPAGHPGPGEGRRRSLRQVVADRRAPRTSRHAGPPPLGLAEWLADRQQQADQDAVRRRAGAVGERRIAEALRARASEPDPAAGRQEPGDPPAERERDGRVRSATASPSTTSATVGAPTGSAPSTFARPTAGACRSRRRAPPTGCRWAETTRSPTSPSGHGAGRVRSATRTVRTVDLGCLRSSGKPRPSAGACRCPCRSC
jgi:hypothetical protein